MQQLPLKIPASLSETAERVRQVDEWLVQMQADFPKLVYTWPCTNPDCPGSLYCGEPHRAVRMLPRWFLFECADCQCPMWGTRGFACPDSITVRDWFVCTICFDWVVEETVERWLCGLMYPEDIGVGLCFHQSEDEARSCLNDEYDVRKQDAER